MRLVVVDADELRRLIEESIKSALQDRSTVGEWVDARTSGLGRRTFLRLVREGTLPASKRGRAHVVLRTDVDAYLQGQRVAPTHAPTLSELPPQRLDGAPFDPIAAALAEGRLRIVKKPP